MGKNKEEKKWSLIARGTWLFKIVLNLVTI